MAAEEPNSDIRIGAKNKSKKTLFMSIRTLRTITRTAICAVREAL